MKNFRNLATLCAGIALTVFFMASCKKGNDGPTGSQGAQGTPGIQGNAGLNGLNGNTLLNGEGAPADTMGVNGDFYLDLIAMNLYGPKAVAGWGLGVSILGRQGIAGANGTNGTNGTTVLVDTFMVTDTDWVNRGTYNHYDQFAAYNAYAYPGMDFVRPVQAIDSSILATGLVMVNVAYLVVYPGYANKWIPIPYTFLSPTWSENLDYVLAAQQVTLEFYLTRLPGSTGSYPSRSDVGTFSAGTLRVKIIVIPGTAVKEISAIMKQKNAAKVSVN